jgi:DnaJ-domain-containing protein 1
MPRLFVKNNSPFGQVGDVEVVLDGRRQLKLSRDETADIPISAGAHTLQARAGSLFSEPLEFRAADRETLGFTCSVSGFWSKRVSVAERYHRRPSERFGEPTAPKPEPPPQGQAAAKSDWAVLLNVGDTASMEEIRRAYLKLIWQYHPDRLLNMSIEKRAAAEVAARQVNMAYNAAKKQRHKN